jgi:predicted transcriptional regulator
MGALSPDDQVDAALERLRSQNRTALPVLDNGRIVGLLTLENVGEMLMVYNARMKGKAR